MIVKANVIGNENVNWCERVRMEVNECDECE